MSTLRITYFANSDWYLYNFRAPLALAARKAFDAEIHCICPDGPYRPRLEAMGFSWFNAPVERQGANPLAEWALQNQVRGILRESRPDLLHNFTLKSVIWGTRAARSEGVPAVVNALAGMGSVFRGGTWKGTLLRPLVTSLLRQTLSGPNQRAIFQNPDDLQLAIDRLKLDPAKSVLIRGSGVDTTRFTPAQELPHPPRILFVGRLLKDKGVLDFCTAAGIIHEKAPQISFQIAGTLDSGNPSSLQDMDVQRISTLQPYLEFLGHVEDMPSCYRQASMAVLPSYGEGVPRSLIEAASCGLPLVSTDVPGCREIVQNDLNGMTVPPKDPQALADAILRLLKQPGLAAALGRHSRLLAESEFSESSVLDRTLSVYKALLDAASL